ncbi:MAG: histidine phosphatase family protein [Pseudomonadota bacterium]
MAIQRSYPPLLILRHGETEWNAKGRLQGHFDAPLTQLGIAQARGQHGILAKRDLSRFRAISSPQGRAITTARIALEGLVPKIKTDNRLSEIGLGHWAGRLRHEVSASASEPFGFYERAPGGEGFAGLTKRCQAFLDTLESPAVLVTHGITSRMLRLLVLGQHVASLADLPGGQGVVYLIEDGIQTRL